MNITKIKLKNLRCGFEKYRKYPHLVEMHRKGDFYRKVKSSIETHGLLNPLIVIKGGEDFYYVQIGNNRYLTLCELTDRFGPEYEVDCVILDDASVANLRSKTKEVNIKPWE